MEHASSSHKAGHEFHLVNPSPWPLCASFALLILAVGGVLYMHHFMLGNFLLPAGILSVLLVMFVWWRDVLKEGRKDRVHTEVVRNGLRIGMGLFILSEMMFFFAFFFAFFYSKVFPMGILEGLWVAKEGIWPPTGITTFDPWDIPFLNTLILLLSGTTVTWAHHEMQYGSQQNVVKGLALTVFLGFCFSLLQAYEYIHAPFGFKQGIYAANFYMATGFHGVHVIIGTLFLLVCLIRAKKGHFSAKEGHLGFEFAAWYWHFVDVVWLFLFAFVYIWGGGSHIAAH